MSWYRTCKHRWVFVKNLEDKNSEWKCANYGCKATEVRYYTVRVTIKKTPAEARVSLLIN